PDLADVAQGEYDGDVISDARGGSQSDVHISVRKIAKNTVQVTSDYPRLPSFTARLTRALDTIQISNGPQVFLLDLSRSPLTLEITDDDASWSGAKSGPAGALPPEPQMGAPP